MFEKHKHQYSFFFHLLIKNEENERIITYSFIKITLKNLNRLNFMETNLKYAIAGLTFLVKSFCQMHYQDKQKK